MATPGTNTSGTQETQTTGDASERGNRVISRVRESATAQLSTQKNKATEGLGSVAQAVRQSTQQLRDQQHETIAGYVESAADQIDRFSRQLRDKDVGELLEDAQRLARKQPAVFIGSAFALGMLGARFFKSSSRDQRPYGRDREQSAYGRGEYFGGTSTPYGSQTRESSADDTGGSDFTSGTARHTAGPTSGKRAATTGSTTASEGSRRKQRSSSDTEK